MEAKKVASESREKSDFEVHKQSELSYAVILDGEHIEEFTDEVAANEYVIWLDGKLAKSWEAGRRDALEEAAKQVSVYEHCSDCAECMKVIAGRLRALEPDTENS